MLLAEDHAATAAQLQTLLQTAFDVVAVVADGATLVSAAERFAPDAVVTDISMPVLDGIDAAVLILQKHPGTRLVLVTVHDELILVDRGVAAGALGYVLKETAGDELVPAVEAALKGQLYISHALRRRAVEGKPE